MHQIKQINANIQLVNFIIYLSAPRFNEHKSQFLINLLEMSVEFIYYCVAISFRRIDRKQWEIENNMNIIQFTFPIQHTTNNL